MAAIINALFGTYPDPEPAAQQTAVEGSTASLDRVQTSAIADDVHVKSVISTQTQANASMNSKLNIDQLLNELGTTHSQVDQYSRDRTAAINEQVKKSIADVLARTKRHQEELLVEANRRHLEIDQDYKFQLQKAIEALDAAKAKTLAQLERELQSKQQSIMAEAKQEIDLLNDQANAAKLQALVEAQEQARQNIDQLTDQVAAAGQLDTHNLLQAKTTTVITSESQAAGTAEVKMETDQQIAVRGATDIVIADASNSQGITDVSIP